jgi:hypothetical protein
MGTMSYVNCSRCRRSTSITKQYCVFCGEPVAPPLVAELQWLYRSVQDLNQRLERDPENETLLALRDEYRQRYLELRKPPEPVVEQPSPAIPVTKPPPDAAQATQKEDTVQPAIWASGAPSTPQQPAFSWRAFLADQAIAIMSYLGGFLLLVAELTFIVGGWNVFSNEIKLGTVFGVYIVFGSLGIFLRRHSQLRTVGEAYLGVFALMTPLLGLAYYRFVPTNQSLPVAGVTSIAAGYATIVYLALAWRTRIAVYSYLGWAALAVAALAIPPWLNQPTESFSVALAALSLLLLITYGWGSRQEAWRELTAPAIQFAALASAIAFLAALAYCLTQLPLAPNNPVERLQGIFALTTILIVPVSAIWSVQLRNLKAPIDVLNMIDWLTAALVTLAAVAVAFWLQADRLGFIYLLTALAALHSGAIVGLRLIVPERSSLRAGIAGWALFLNAIAWLMSIIDARPNWEVVFALAAATLLMATLMIVEQKRDWLLGAGISTSLLYYNVILNLIMPTKEISFSDVFQIPVFIHIPGNVYSYYQVLFTLTLWAAGLALSFAGERQHTYSPYLYTIASLNGLYAMICLTSVSGVGYVTVVLASFTVATFLSSWWEQLVEMANLSSCILTAITAIPLLIHSGGTHAFHNQATLIWLSIVPWLLVLLVQIRPGRGWSYGLYITAILISLFTMAALLNNVRVDLFILGLPIITSIQMVTAVLASIAAWRYQQLRLYMIPAAFLFMAIAALRLLAFNTQDTVRYAIGVVVIEAIVIGAGLLSYQWRTLLLGNGTATDGQQLGAIWYGAAVLGSVAIANQLLDFGHTWETAFLLALAAIAYLIATQWRAVWVTVATPVYITTSLFIWHNPQHDAFIYELVLIGCMIALGIALRMVRVPFSWVTAIYCSAVLASIFALSNETNGTNQLTILLIIFTALAYFIALYERSHWIGMIAALYASSISFIQSDLHLLLFLVIAFALVAIIAGRLSTLQWSWPLYVVSSILAIATLIQQPFSSPSEALTLAIITVLAYIVAAIESRPDILAGALLIGGMWLIATQGAYNWDNWLRIISIIGLAWLYAGLELLWRWLPWMNEHGMAWWQGSYASDMRVAGRWVHRVAALALSSGTFVYALILPDNFATHAATTAAAIGCLLALAAILMLYALKVSSLYPALYSAGLALALAGTWGLRWLGIDNIQAYVILPGSYLIFIGVMIPADRRLKIPPIWSQTAMLAGSLALLLPALQQSIDADQRWIYALVLAFESLLIAGVGVGTRSRLILATGLGFTGIAAIRGAVLAVDSGIPVALVIGVFAILLMATATWLSLRSRPEA